MANTVAFALEHVVRQPHIVLFAHLGNIGKGGFGIHVVGQMFRLVFGADLTAANAEKPFATQFFFTAKRHEFHRVGVFGRGRFDVPYHLHGDGCERFDHRAVGTVPFARFSK